MLVSFCCWQKRYLMGIPTPSAGGPFAPEKMEVRVAIAALARVLIQVESEARQKN